MIRTILLLHIFLYSIMLSAQTDIYERLPITTGTKADLPSPAEFPGYELGKRFTEYARSVEYFKMLAEKSDRIDIQKYGATYEARPLLMLTISSLENMARIDEIKANQQTLVARTQVQGTLEVQAAKIEPASSCLTAKNLTV